MKIVITSDWHLGLSKCPATIEDLQKVLDRENPDMAIFAGDTVDILARATSRGKLLELIGSMTCTSYFLNGNHDNVFTQDNMSLLVDGKRIWISHGHEYDDWLTKLIDPVTVRINELCVRWFSRNPQAWLRYKCEKKYPEGMFVPKLYRQRLMAMKKFDIADIVVCGHTHYPEVFKNGDKIYANPGNYGHYIVIDNGTVELRSV